MKKESSRSAPSNVFEGMISVRAVFRAIDEGRSDRRIEELLFSEDNVKKNARLLGFLRARAAELGYKLTVCPTSEIDALATGSSHGGVIMLCTSRSYPTVPESIPKSGFYVALDGIEDPYNFGYAVRSLYAAGVTGILLPERNWTSAAGVVCRSSAGASELIDTYCGELPQMISLLKQNGYRLAVSEAEAPQTAYEAELSYPLVLAVGGERRGISSAVRELADIKISIPYGRRFDEALSAASAASILAFEAARQNLRPARGLDM